MFKKMASSVEAFEKPRRWKKSNTVLKLTVVTNDGVPDRHIGSVFSVAEEELLVGFMVKRTRRPFLLNLSGASFVLGARSLAAEKGEYNFVAFEEL